MTTADVQSLEPIRQDNERGASGYTGDAHTQKKGLAKKPKQIGFIFCSLYKTPLGLLIKQVSLDLQ